MVLEIPHFKKQPYPTLNAIFHTNVHSVFLAGWWTTRTSQSPVGNCLCSPLDCQNMRAIVHSEKGSNPHSWCLNATILWFNLLCESHTFPRTIAGWWFQPTPLKNMTSSVGMILPNMMGKNKMIQTTNQIVIYPLLTGSALPHILFPGWTRPSLGFPTAQSAGNTRDIWEVLGDGIQ